MNLLPQFARKAFYAYIHCKPDGMPFYVGKGIKSRCYNFAKRSEHHKRIVNKYGKENITVWTFLCASEQSAFSLERYLIAHYKRIGMPLCNRTDGGEGTSGCVVSAATGLRISEAKKGKKFTEEHKAKLRAAWEKREAFSDETRARMSAGKIGNKCGVGNKNNLGKKRTAESCARMSAAHIGKPAHNKGVPCSQAQRDKISATLKARRHVNV